MEYFAGLDVSMAETQVCVVTRDGAVIHKAKVPSTPADIAAELAQVPTCRRVVFETGRMAPMLYHGLSQLGSPVVCVESRQAYQALKLLATHKTDRNDARGLAHLARTGFFKPVHVKSLTAHAVRSLITARKKLVGQRVTLENQIRGLAVVFGIHGKLLRFAATTDPTATLSPSIDFPVAPVIRSTLLRRFRAGARRASPVARHVLATVLSLPPRRSEGAASVRFRLPMLPSPSSCELGLRGYALSRPHSRLLSLRPGGSSSPRGRRCR